MLYFTEKKVHMKTYKSYKEYKRDALKDPELKAAYDALEPEFRIAESMIKARVAKNLTQEQLAKKAGVTQNTIARLESGTNNPTVATISRVAGVLGKELRLVASR
jgi:DNA-binding XRE family transcriptional regulator